MVQIKLLGFSVDFTDDWGDMHMTDFCVNYGELSKYVNEIDSMRKQLIDKQQQIKNVKKAITSIVYGNVSVSLDLAISKIDREINGFKILGETLNSICRFYQCTEKRLCGYKVTESSNDKMVPDYEEKNWIDQIDEAMDSVNDFMYKFDYHYYKIVNAIQDAALMDSVVAFGISGSIGTGAYGSIAAQFVVDGDGNIGIQIVPGTGIEAGSSADASLYAAVYPGTETIYDLEGFGVEVGGSGGEGGIVSGALLFSGEGDETELAGVSAGIGLGGEATVGEGHISMSETLPTIPLGNVYTNSVDIITGQWSIIYKGWKSAKNVIDYIQ